MLLLAALYGCNNDAVNDSSLQIAESDITTLDGSLLDCMLDSWEPIYLEDSESALTAYIHNVHSDDGLLFVQSGMWDNSSVMVFDTAGHYLNNIGHRGNASYEYNYLTAWTLDPVHKEVILIDTYPVTLMYYDYSGKFLRKTAVEESELNTDVGQGTDICRMQDGTILLRNTMSTTSTDDYIVIHPDGSINALFARRDYRLEPTEDGYDYSLKIANVFYDPHCSNTWMMRRFDNHLYCACTGDTAQCIANLSFIEEIPDNIKMSFSPDHGIQKYGNSVLSRLLCMRDYLIINHLSRQDSYIYDKGTSKLYNAVWNDETFNRIPYASVRGCFDNTLIGVIDITDAADWLESNGESPEEEVSEEVKSIFRKTASRDNPTIILYHLKPVQTEKQ